MKQISLGVIGTGHFGRFHTLNAAGLGVSCRLAGVSDLDEARGKRVAQEFNTRFFKNLPDLLAEVSAVIVAVPATQHETVGLMCLKSGAHTFMEKPLAHSVAAGQKLVETADQKNLVFQVGHLERFNPGITGLSNGGFGNVTHFESTRTAPFTPRGTDVSVVFEVMIHDLDLALTLIKSHPISISAKMQSKKTKTGDHCLATVVFENGAQARFSADRASDSLKRTISLKSQGQSTEVDLAAAQKNAASDFNPLLWEQKSFVQSIIQKTTPAVTGASALKALALAEQIQTAAGKW